MAIWQYKLYFLPEEEVRSYFPNGGALSENAFSEVQWWKYRQLYLSNFTDVKAVLPLKKSWSDDIMLFGELDSNCSEVFTESGIAVEASARIDLRGDYRDMITLICQFSQNNKLILLDYKWHILPPENIITEKVYK